MLWDFLKERMRLHSNQTLTENETVLTYGQALEKAEELARALPKRKLCAVLCSSELNTAISILTCIAADAVAVPLSYRYGETHYKRILSTLQPDLIITDETRQIKCRAIKHRSRMDEELLPDVCFILCTSGTTGIPKGAMVTQENITSNLIDIERYFPLSTEDNILIIRPLYHCAVLTGEFLIGLLKGANICFSSVTFNPIQVVSFVQKYLVTVMGGTPTLFFHIANILKRFDKQSIFLRKIVISGECMTERVAKNLIKFLPQVDKYSVYGLTEASPRVSFLLPEEFDQYFMSVGRPLYSVDIKIVKHRGLLAERNEVGELWVRGPNVMKGYYHNPDATNRVITDGWLHTGDLAYIDSTGRIFIKGRKDHMIIRGGVNIYPAEIENALKQYENIKEVMAYGFEDNISSQGIGIKVIVDSEMDKDSVYRLCKKCLPDYELPNVIEIVDSLPHNASGKVIRSITR